MKSHVSRYTDSFLKEVSRSQRRIIINKNYQSSPAVVLTRPDTMRDARLTLRRRACQRRKLKFEDPATKRLTDILAM